MPNLKKRKDDTYQPAILLFKGKGTVSRAIRWWTFSEYSHAAILMPDGKIIESWQGKGVQIKELTDWSNVDVFYVKGMTEAQWDIAIHFAKSQLGKPYDYIGITNFITRATPAENFRWFCSELVFAACLKAGVSLLKRIRSGRAAPAHLSLSPLLNGETEYEKLLLTTPDRGVVSRMLFHIRRVA